MQAVLKRALVIVVSLILSGAVINLPAQTFSVLHTFSAVNGVNYTNGEGSQPAAILCLSNSVLYGATSYGGTSGWGTLFSLGTDGSGFRTLHNFTRLDHQSGTNDDGAGVTANLILSGEYLYGIASDGGHFGGGTLFKVRTDGSGFTNFYHFIPSSTTNSGASACIAMVGDVLYGTTSRGGDSAVGMIFKINLDGTGFTNLHSFSAPSAFQGLGTNADGMYPGAGLILSGDTLFGTAGTGGALGFGTVFKITTNGTAFAVLHAFSGWYNGADGASPHGLLLSGNTLYGTTVFGSTFGNGTVFTIGTDGTGFTNLYAFTSNGTNYYLTNFDGAGPNAGLILSGDTLYGTTSHAGPIGTATVFALNTNGNVFTMVHAFPPGNYNTGSTNSIQVYTNSEGLDPFVGLTLSGDALYGTTYDGGNGGAGTVFKISFRPTLTLTTSDTQRVLSWPASYGGFDFSGFGLQTATNLDSTAFWTSVDWPAVLLYGKYTASNSIPGTQQFYRLSR